MSNRLVSPRPFGSLITAALLFLHAVTLALGNDGSIELTSPKNNDHFEVTKPLFYWKSSPGAQSYELYVDDAQAGQVAAAALPVLNCAVTTALAVGPHHWYIKAVPASGEAATSATSTFTVDPLGNWPTWAIGPFERYGGNPILTPQGTTWESVNALSPGVLFDQGKFRMLYRAQGKSWPSVEGYAESEDGVTFTRRPEPVLDRSEPFEAKNGCEDARFFKKDGVYYAFYTGNGPQTRIAICEATSSDGTTWKKLGPVVDGTKNGAVICDPNGTPVRINGKFAMFVGNSNFGLSYSDDLLTWTPMQKIDLKLPKSWVTPYEPCFAVTDFSKSQPDEVVLFIAGTLNGKGKWFYAISETLFSKSDLTRKVDQLDDCIITPRETYESGQEKNSLWMNCIIQHNGQWMLYYAAGDRNVALGTCPVK